MIEIFEEIIDSLDAKTKGSRNQWCQGCTVASYDFNLFLADLLQISNNFFKFLQSRTIQFSSLPGKVDRMKKHFRKYKENIETERSFFLDYVDNYLHAADQLSKLSC